MALVERSDWILYLFGAFLRYTAGKLIFTDNDDADAALVRDAFEDQTDSESQGA